MLAKGQRLDVLIGNGGVTVFRCQRRGLRMWLFWAFVGMAVLGAIAAAI